MPYLNAFFSWVSGNMLLTLALIYFVWKAERFVMQYRLSYMSDEDNYLGKDFDIWSKLLLTLMYLVRLIEVVLCFALILAAAKRWFV